MAETNREAIGRVTAAIIDLQALLQAERCLATVDLITDGRTLMWARWGRGGKWMVLAEDVDGFTPLLSLPALDRLQAYPYLGKLADAAREKMAAAVARAGLGLTEGGAK